MMCGVDSERNFVEICRHCQFCNVTLLKCIISHDCTAIGIKLLPWLCCNLSYLILSHLLEFLFLSLGHGLLISGFFLHTLVPGLGRRLLLRAPAKIALTSLCSLHYRVWYMWVWDEHMTNLYLGTGDVCVKFINYTTMRLCDWHVW
jgi:hypothetical protein